MSLPNSFLFNFLNSKHTHTRSPLTFLFKAGRICDNYESFYTRHHLLTCRLVKQGFLYDKLVTSFKKFCGGYPEIFSKLESM